MFLQLPIAIETVSITNSFWIELDGFFCQTKINFTIPDPLPTSTMEPVVTTIHNWKL